MKIEVGKYYYRISDHENIFYCLENINPRKLNFEYNLKCICIKSSNHDYWKPGEEIFFDEFGYCDQSSHIVYLHLGEECLEGL